MDRAVHTTCIARTESRLVDHSLTETAQRAMSCIRDTSSFRTQSCQGTEVKRPGPLGKAGLFQEIRRWNYLVHRPVKTRLRWTPRATQGLRCLAANSHQWHTGPARVSLSSMPHTLQVSPTQQASRRRLHTFGSMRCAQAGSNKLTRLQVPHMCTPAGKQSSTADPGMIAGGHSGTAVSAATTVCAAIACGHCSAPLKSDGV